MDDHLAGRRIDVLHVRHRVPHHDVGLPQRDGDGLLELPQLIAIGAIDHILDRRVHGFRVQLAALDGERNDDS